MAITATVNMVRGGQAARLWAWAAALAVFIAAGCGVVAFGRWLARGEQAFLTDFVCRTIDARVVEQPVGR